MVSRLQKEIEDLVLEIFERLPQTVDGFEGGGLIREGMKVSHSGLRWKEQELLYAFQALFSV